MIIHVDKPGVNTGLGYYDSFEASQEIYSQNHLLHVGSGATVIFYSYPYLGLGILTSMAGTLLTAVYTWHTKRRMGKKTQEMG